jgi:hypothetical protein
VEKKLDRPILLCLMDSWSYHPQHKRTAFLAKKFLARMDQGRCVGKSLVDFPAQG